MSCERLRALLPQFEGRREDMASVLEMAVRFLQLARGLAPAWERPGVSVGAGWVARTWGSVLLLP